MWSEADSGTWKEEQDDGDPDYPGTGALCASFRSGSAKYSE